MSQSLEQVARVGIRLLTIQAPMAHLTPKKPWQQNNKNPISLGGSKFKGNCRWGVKGI